MLLSTKHTIVNGDSRHMAELSDESVHLIVTSPPYWQLKDYGVDDQIGFNDDYETYVNHLNLVWSECFRVLQKGCRLCVNIGDQFARSTYYGRYKVIPIHTEIIKFCEVIGFDFMGQIIWQKSTTMNTSGGGSVMGSYPYPRNGIVKLDFEYILLFKKRGVAPKPSKQQKESAAMTNEEWNTYFSGHWYFNGAKQDKHLAMFPEELPRRLIKMFSFPGETVLDPFLGSGTTSLAARKLGRNSIGYEINENFLPVITSKIREGSLLEETGIKVLKQTRKVNDFNILISQLPYQFVDFHRLDKKIDVKKLQYGSKIDANSSGKRNDLFSVKAVFSPELLQLSNDLKIRLIGIKRNLLTSDQAVAYLVNLVRGKRVFIRYDSVKYDEENNLMVYLYLENMTFVNAHLLKRKLATVDCSFDFKYKSKFMALVNTDR